jgi:hypothetical protein
VICIWHDKVEGQEREEPRITPESIAYLSNNMLGSEVKDIEREACRSEANRYAPCTHSRAGTSIRSAFEADQIENRAGVDREQIEGISSA